MACDVDIVKDLDKTTYDIVLLEKDAAIRSKMESILSSIALRTSKLNITPNITAIQSKESIIIINGSNYNSLIELYATIKKATKSFKILIYNQETIPFGLKNIEIIQLKDLRKKFLTNLNSLKKEAIEKSGGDLVKVFLVAVILISSITILLADMNTLYAAIFMIAIILLGFSKRIFKLIFFYLGMKKAQAYCECL